MYTRTQQKMANQNFKDQLWSYLQDQKPKDTVP